MGDPGMSFFDNFGKKVGKVASDAAVKSRELADTARYSVSIADERAVIRGRYRDLGECYYKKYRQADIPELQTFCGQIDKADERIKELEQKIRSIKGIQVCSACLAESDRKARFCAACGAPLSHEQASRETPSPQQASRETPQAD